MQHRYHLTSNAVHEGAPLCAPTGGLQSAWLNLLSDLRMSHHLRRHSLSEVINFELVQRRSRDVDRSLQHSEIIESIQRQLQLAIGPQRDTLAQLAASLKSSGGTSRPSVIPIKRLGRPLYAITEMGLADWVLSKPNEFERSTALDSFAAAFGLESVFTTHDKQLAGSLRRYFRGTTNDLTSRQLIDIYHVLNQHVDGMLSKISPCEPTTFVSRIEGMVLSAYAQSFFDIEDFPDATGTTELIKDIWTIKSRRNNLPLARLNVLAYLRMRRMRRRLLDRMNGITQRVSQYRPSKIERMASVYNDNGYSAGNLLNALIPLYEALARAVVFATIELAKAPSLQDELRSEFIANDHRELEYCADKSTLLHRVWLETLRLWPPTPNQTRQVMSDDNPLFPKGSRVVIVWSVFHRNAEVWGSDADSFDPARWVAITAKQESNYHPFGAGAQHCVAMDYAGFGGRTILKRILGSRQLDLPNVMPTSIITDRGYSRGPDPKTSLLQFNDLN